MSGALLAIFAEGRRVDHRALLPSRTNEQANVLWGARRRSQVRGRLLGSPRRRARRGGPPAARTARRPELRPLDDEESVVLQSWAAGRPLCDRRQGASPHSTRSWRGVRVASAHCAVKEPSWPAANRAILLRMNARYGPNTAQIEEFLHRLRGFTTSQWTRPSVIGAPAMRIQDDELPPDPWHEALLEAQDAWPDDQFQVYAAMSQRALNAPLEFASVAQHSAFNVMGALQRGACALFCRPWIDDEVFSLAYQGAEALVPVDSLSESCPKFPRREGPPRHRESRSGTVELNVAVYLDDSQQK